MLASVLQNNIWNHVNLAHSFLLISPTIILIVVSFMLINFTTNVSTNYYNWKPIEFHTTA